MTKPLTVDLRRGHPERQTLESSHRVHAVVVDADGSVVRAWGDPDRITFPRSAIKPVQAIPLVETGAADAFGLSDRELALACASHNGEVGHIEAVAAWLDRIGCRVDDLECGPQSSPRGGEAGSAVANNCSGKHTGFLTVCRHLGLDIAGYIAADHPVQHLVTDALAKWCGHDFDRSRAAVDGCGIPAHAMPLGALACSAARVAVEPSDWPDSRGNAIRRLTAAMAAEPWYVAGTGRMVTEVLERAAGSLIVKDGAEGVHWASLLDKRLGVAVKCEDGSNRASEAALGHVLDQIGATAVSDVFAHRRTIGNWAGRPVGQLVISS